MFKSSILHTPTGLNLHMVDTEENHIVLVHCEWQPRCYSLHRHPEAPDLHRHTHNLSDLMFSAQPQGTLYIPRSIQENMTSGQGSSLHRHDSSCIGNRARLDYTVQFQHIAHILYRTGDRHWSVNCRAVPIVRREVNTGTQRHQYCQCNDARLWNL